MAETYSEQVLLKLTTEQKQQLRDDSAAADLSQNEYMRQRIFRASSPITPPHWLAIQDLAGRLSAVEAEHPTTRRRPPMAKLFEYAVILQEKRDKDGEEVEAAEIVVEPTTVLARDEGQAQMLAARAIPEKYLGIGTKGGGKLDRLMVVCRPF